MSKVMNLKVERIKKGTTRKGKPMWIIETDLPDDLFVFDFAKIADIQAGEEATFTLVEDNGYLNVESGVPIIDVNADMKPDASEDYPEPRELSEPGDKPAPRKPRSPAAQGKRLAQERGDSTLEVRKTALMAASTALSGFFAENFSGAEDVDFLTNLLTAVAEKLEPYANGSPF